MVEAKWTGDYPTLCTGEWILKVDGVDVSNKIPDELRSTMSNIRNQDAETLNGMNTYGEYCQYDECEESESWHIDGLRCEDWIRANSYWLDTITTDHDTQVDIYNAINEQDWRRNSCGGCI